MRSMARFSLSQVALTAVLLSQPNIANAQAPVQSSHKSSTQGSMKTDWNCCDSSFLLGSLASLQVFRQAVAPPTTFKRAKLSEVQDIAFRLDSIKWLSYVLRPAMLPCDLLDHLIPVKSKHLEALTGAVLLGTEVSADQYQDGYLIRYRQGPTLIQIQDLACQLTVIATSRDLQAKTDTQADRLSYARKMMAILLRDQFSVYSNGTPRYVCANNSPKYLYFSWRWDLDSESDDILWNCGAFPASWDLSVSVVPEFMTDGKVCIIAFQKSCVGPGAIDTPRTSRFTDLARFRTMTESEWLGWRKDAVRQLHLQLPQTKVDPRRTR